MTARPTALPVIPENIPPDLTERPQWLLWRYVWRGAKWTKPPFCARGGPGRSNDSRTWGTFTEVFEHYRHGGFDGIGFAFAKGDGLTGIDLDHVIDLTTGEIDPRAREIIERFAGTYIEYSPSGEGLRIFCRGQAPRCGKNVGNPKWLEVYDWRSPRYLTVTGHVLGSAP